jgi:hypothetical protein
MDKLFIEEQEDSPSILFDKTIGFIEIKGKSLPEDAIVFYSKLEEQVRQYAENPLQKTTVNFKLEYLNSSSAKKILEIITLLEPLPKKGYVVNLNWIYKDEDEDMFEEGQEFARMTDLHVNFEREIKVD